MPIRRDKIRNQSDVIGAIEGIYSQLVPGVVLQVNQDNNYNNGAILVEQLTTSGPVANQGNILAYPLFPNIKIQPLVNETVYLISFPSQNYSQDSSSRKYYYINPVSLWNTPHTNPTPTTYTNIKSSTQKKTIPEIEAGATNKSAESGSEQVVFKPGTYFVEKDNIYPLYPFEGDVIFEGRFGNSIRFGSTNSIFGGETYESIPVVRTFGAQTTYTSGQGGVTEDLDKQLSQIDSQVAQLKRQYPDANVSVTVEGGESRVTNPNNIAQGGLAEQRANDVTTQLSSYSNISTSNVTQNTVIGDTPYTRGIDNPKDEKYTPEQYSKVTIQVQGTAIVRTQSPSTALNSWSSGSSQNGDPITILRNGQDPSLPGPAQSLTTESVNADLSSIYLTSTQQIPIEVSSTNGYLSYDKSSSPTQPNQYAGNQIILNSGRLVLNASNNHILLSSFNSINLNAKQSVNIDTLGDAVFQANNVYLGGRDNSQPVVLGNELVDLLTDILDDLNYLTSRLAIQLDPSSGSPLEPTSTGGKVVRANIQGYKTRLKEILSSTTKTV